MNYTATIAEGKNAVREAMETKGATSISLAFVDGERLVWAETFGLADKESKTAPTADTMYCIGSTSKMLAAIAVMKLVEQGRISGIDAPLTTYMPSFSMLSPEYTRITPRMLINHSSGFPGTDERNAETSSPLPFSFSAQVLETVKTQRLKHPPGYLHVYCNDGFTLTEQLVLAVTGKSYAQFVQEEIFTPLGMSHSRYPLDYFPDGSFAKRYNGNVPLPQLFLNTLGSGGLYSTPTDMAKIAMMLIGRGKLGDVRILSEDSVRAMGVDQTVGSFNPAPATDSRYGLGWDTVRQGGLNAVNVIGWQKGGDVPQYGSVMTVAPEEGLAVIVLGASGDFHSSNATLVAERILLRALAEKGRIEAMPMPLSLSPRPLKTPASGQLDSVSGYYATNSKLIRVQKGPDNALNITTYDAGANKWKDFITGDTHSITAFILRDDDRFYGDADVSKAVSFTRAEGRRYLILRSVKGYGHYQDDLIYAQQVSASGSMPASWSGRLGKRWLLTNEHSDSEKWESPLMQLTAYDNLLFANNDQGGLQIVNPFFGDSRAGMMLLIPQVNGRDLSDVVIETRAGAEWLRHLGSCLYCPQETITALSVGNNAVSIGGEGLAEWRVLNVANAKTVTINPSAPDGHWRIFNSAFERKETGAGIKSVTLSGGTYYLLFHNDATVNVI